MQTQRAEADLGLTYQAFGRENPEDSKLLVRFSIEPHPDAEASIREGRPIFKDREYITIIVPGDKDSVVIRPVWSKDLQRFPRQYQAFKANLDQSTSDGTPLAQWPPISKSQVLELNYFNVKTVEQLANLADGHAQKFAGIQSIRKLARDWLAAAKDTAHLTQMQAELEKRDSQIAVNNRTIADMASRLDAMEKVVKERGDE